jgi:hypothetical protein
VDPSARVGRIDGVKARAVLALLLALAVFVPAGAAAAPARVLALTGGAIGSNSRLVPLDSVTLVQRGSGLSLPGWAFGVEWGRSPDRSQVALVPKPSETDEALFVIATSGRLSTLSRLSVPGEDVCRLAWPSARLILLVVTRGPACYQPITSARVVVVDPLRGRVVAQRPLSGPATIVASASTPDGLALVLGPAPRLAIVSATHTRVFAMPSVRSPLRPLDKGAGAAVGLAVDPAGDRAYVVEPSGRITELDLATGRTSVHEPVLRRPAVLEKGATGSIVNAVWAGRRSLAISGARRVGGRLVPAGLRLVDTLTWRSRLLDARASGVAYVRGTILAYQPLAPRTPPIGLRAFTRAGGKLFNAFAGEHVTRVLSERDYAYVAGAGLGAIVDVHTGRRRRATVPYLLLADGGS